MFGKKIRDKGQTSDFRSRTKKSGTLGLSKKIRDKGQNYPGQRANTLYLDNAINYWAGIDCAGSGIIPNAF